MRGLLIVLAGVALSGCYRNHWSRAMGDRRAAEERYAARFGTGPLPAHTATLLPTRVESERFTFSMPGPWWRYPGTPRLVFADAGARHQVEMTVLPTSDDERTFIARRFAGAHATSQMKIGSRLVHLATRRDPDYVVTAAVIADRGSIYELTCSSRDTTSGVTDQLCVEVLSTLRVH